MSKTGDTKARIIKILESHRKTLTDISGMLGLAPSTVSQHLKELTDEGKIRLADGRPRKWKYYELNTNVYQQGNRWEYAKKFAAPVAVILLVAIGAVALSGYNAHGTAATATQLDAKQLELAPGSSIPNGSTIFTVSDSPGFDNISALNITVANASITSSATGVRYNIPLESNTFDLVKLRNISTLLTGVNLSAGSYSNLVLYITNITAVVNGTSENVLLPSGKLTIIADFNITNSTTNWINLDFDIARSLHMTSSGQIIMLPVLEVSHTYDDGLQLNSSNIIIAEGPGRMGQTMEFGMDTNGDFMSNYSMPQNVSIITRNGRFEVSGNGDVPIVLRTNLGFVIGGNATGIVNYWNSVNASYPNAYGNSIMMVNSTAALGPCMRPYAASNATEIAARCCSMWQTGTYGNANISIGNSSVEVSKSDNGTPYYSCCFPIAVTSDHSNIMARSCQRLPFSMGVNATDEPIGKGNIMINLSVRANASRISARCVYENGALSCGSYGAAPINSSTDWPNVTVGSGEGISGAVMPNGIGSRNVPAGIPIIRVSSNSALNMS